MTATFGKQKGEVARLIAWTGDGWSPMGERPEAQAVGERRSERP